MLKIIIINLIKFYQNYISPHKGFICAYGSVNNEKGCSEYGKKVIERFGFFVGIKLLNRRFYDCSWFAKKISKKNKSTYKRYRHSQAGFCDGCDFGDVSCDVADTCDVLSCDFGDGDNSTKNKNFSEKREAKNKRKYDNIISKQ